MNNRFRNISFSLLAVIMVCLANVNAQENQSPVPAVPLHPEEVVARLIQASQENDLEGVLSTTDFVAIAKGRHGEDARFLISKLRNIGLKKTRYTSRIDPEDTTKAMVRINDTDYSIDFDLELRRRSVLEGRKLVTPPPHYVVVSVHP